MEWAKINDMQRDAKENIEIDGMERGKEGKKLIDGGLKA